MELFGDTDPATAVAELLEHTAPLEPEPVPLAEPADALGRVLAEPVTLDRDSPACDVSAMDGYAVRHAELLAGPLPLVGECRIGQSPTPLPAASATRIYTGSPVPPGADAVARLEWVEQGKDRIHPREDRPIRAGQDIRRRGENAAAGDTVIEASVPLTQAGVAALATVGATQLTCHRRLRVAVLTTGDEIIDPSSEAGSIQPWQVRNSNGPALAALLGTLPFVATVTQQHVIDSAEGTAAGLREAVASADAVVLTGGVSKGNHDHVRGAIESVGGKRLFHGLAARPGRPTLGAVVDGTPVLGLPGNPVAVLTTSRRLLVPVLRRRAGVVRAERPAALVSLESWAGKTLPLAWWRPVRLNDDGRATLASLRGSGDVIGPAQTDGFIEAPPHADGCGPFPFYPWRPE